MNTKLDKYQSLIERMISEANQAAAAGRGGVDLDTVIALLNQLPAMLNIISDEGYARGFIEGKHASGQVKH